MGSDNNTTIIYDYHWEDLEKIRREEDERKQKRLLDEKIAEYNLEAKRLEIERLVKLDELNFQKEIQRLKVEEKKNDQMNIRETLKITNNHEENMKSLINSETKINNEFKQTIRKYDDEKELNTIKERNSFLFDNKKMEMDFELNYKKLLIDDYDNKEKRHNERKRDEENFEARKMELNYNLRKEMQGILRLQKRDSMENQRLTQEMFEKAKIESKKENNYFLIKQKELNDNYNLRDKEINNDFLIKNKDIARKEKNEHEKNENERLRILEEGKNNDKNFQLNMKNLEMSHTRMLGELDRQKKMDEINAKNNHEKDMRLIDERMGERKCNHEKEMKDMDYKHEIDKIELENKFKLQMDLSNKQFQMQMSMLQMNGTLILNNYNAMIKNNQKENQSDKDNHNQNSIPLMFPLCGFQMMDMNNMKQNEKNNMMNPNNLFAFPMMNMMVNSNQK
jgi:hypothetical protein